MWRKAPPPLGDFEQLVLMGVLRLGDTAYGAAIRQEIHARSGRDVSISAVYTTLDRLEGKGLLESWIAPPTAERGGRRRKCYSARPAGVAALRHAYGALTAMADGLEARLEVQGPSGNNGGTLAVDASRLAALLVGRMLPPCFLLAPGDPGALPPRRCLTYSPMGPT